MLLFLHRQSCQSQKTWEPILIPYLKSSKRPPLHISLTGPSPPGRGFNKTLIGSQFRCAVAGHCTNTATPESPALKSRDRQRKGKADKPHFAGYEGLLAGGARPVPCLRRPRRGFWSPRYLHGADAAKDQGGGEPPSGGNPALEGGNVSDIEAGQSAVGADGVARLLVEEPGEREEAPLSYARSRCPCVLARRAGGRGCWAGSCAVS